MLIVIAETEKWKKRLHIQFKKNMENQLFQWTHQQARQEQTNEQCLKGD